MNPQSTPSKVVAVNDLSPEKKTALRLEIFDRMAANQTGRLPSPVLGVRSHIKLVSELHDLERCHIIGNIMDRLIQQELDKANLIFLDEVAP